MRPSTLNKYVYADSDPVNLSDPSGFMSVAELTISQSLMTSMRTVSVSVGTRFITRAASRLLLAFGTAALSSSSAVMNNEAAFREARNEQERKVIAAAAGASASSLLFHYTDPLSAAEILGCRCIIASPPYWGHVTRGDGVFRPEGAYATPMPPWHPTSTQRDLASFIYLRPGGRSVATAVVIRNNGDWRALTGIEWIKGGPRGSFVPVDAFMVVPNLMKP